MQTPNLQSSSRSVALRACWVQIAHTSTVLLVGSLGGTEQKKVPASSTFPKHSPCYWVAFSLLSLPFFWFLLQPWAVSDSPLFSSPLQLFSVTKHPASHPLTLFPSKLGESECKAGGWGRGEIDKATSVSDTNMAQSQHQYYVCAPSFSASHRVIDPPPCPAPFPFPVQVCPLPALTLKAAILAEKVVVWPDGAVFSSDSTLSASVGRGLVGAFEWF